MPSLGLEQSGEILGKGMEKLFPSYNYRPVV